MSINLITFFRSSLFCWLVHVHWIPCGITQIKWRSFKLLKCAFFTKIFKSPFAHYRWSIVIFQKYNNLVALYVVQLFHVFTNWHEWWYYLFLRKHFLFVTFYNSNIFSTCFVTKSYFRYTYCFIFSSECMIFFCQM